MAYIHVYKGEKINDLCYVTILGADPEIFLGKWCKNALLQFCA